jgi:glutathione peroxidase
VKSLLLLLLLVNSAAVVSAAPVCSPLLQHKFQSLQKKPVDLCQYANRPILVVNTASKCGYTPQFDKLEAMNRRYGKQGLVVIGFPSNDFNQELKSNEEIERFCRLTYLVEFPMIEQGAVRGPAANAFFRQLAGAAGEEPQWNFHKYLIAPDGKTVYSFRSEVEPDAPALMKRLVPMLQKR